MLIALLFSWLALAGHHGQLFAQESRTSTIDARSQEKAWEVLQKAIAEYWNGTEAKTSSATNAAATETNVEAAFRAASKLMPDRLDLRFGIASCLVSQAAGTNGQRLEVKLREALQVYQKIAALDANGFDAPLLLAAYSRAMGDTNSASSVLDGLMAVYPERTRQYVERFERIDRTLQVVPDERPPKTKSGGTRRAIVVLGAGLETNGTIKAKLVARLEQCRKLARLYRDAPIILTGGNPKGGVTEAYVMSQWCLRKGIRCQRIWLEDKARDTVENALYTSAILQKLGVTEVTVVTSLSHMRRGLADLEEACRQRGLNIQFDNLAARTKGEVEFDKEQERISVYRDVLRTSGLWAFPGLQR